MTGTCQVLTEGYYNGILIPNVHYIPLKKDFSNIDEVIRRIKEDIDRNFLIKNAYNDIVESEKYNINKYLILILNQIMSCLYQFIQILSDIKSRRS